jgi:hypothetical protein
MRPHLGLVVVALVLTACGSTAPAAGPSDEAAATETSAAATAAQFGAPLDLGSGVAVTISAPASFTPGDFASNYFPGQVAQLFTVAVENKGTAALDLSTVTFAATSSGNFCTDVLDGDNGINGAPTDPVAAGGSVSFKYAVACDAKVGDPIELGIVFGDTNAALTGKLA